jgi:hypothetical protein
VKPNAGLSEVLNSASKELNRYDNLIVFGGSNDCDKQVYRSNITSLANFLKDSQNTNIILAEVPLRHDIGIKSSKNEQILKHNRIMHKIAKGHKHVKLISITPNREYFTRHGFHFNRMGKEEISKMIIKCLPTDPNNQEAVVLELPWKEEPERPTSRSMPFDELCETETIAKDKNMVNVNNQCDPTISTFTTDGTSIITNPTPINGLSSLQEGKQEKNCNSKNKQEISSNPKSQRNCPKLRNKDFYGARWMLLQHE